MRRAGTVCTRSRSQRALMVAGSVFLAAFTIGSLDQLWAAIPAGAAAGMFAVAAVTGWCPAQLLTPAAASPPANTLGYDEARQPSTSAPLPERTIHDHHDRP